MAKAPLFSEDFLNKAATDIWASARIHAQERRTGRSMNSKDQVDRIRRELQGAATIIATELLERQEEFKGLRQELGEARGEIKTLRNHLADVRKENDFAVRELRCVREELTELKSQTTPGRPVKQTTQAAPKPKPTKPKETRKKEPSSKKAAVKPVEPVAKPAEPAAELPESVNFETARQMCSKMLKQSSESQLTAEQIREREEELRNSGQIL